MLIRDQGALFSEKVKILTVIKYPFLRAFLDIACADKLLLDKSKKNFNNSRRPLSEPRITNFNRYLSSSFKIVFTMSKVTKMNLGYESLLNKLPNIRAWFFYQFQTVPDSPNLFVYIFIF